MALAILKEEYEERLKAEKAYRRNAEDRLLLAEEDIRQLLREREFLKRVLRGRREDGGRSSRSGRDSQRGRGSKRSSSVDSRASLALSERIQDLINEMEAVTRLMAGMEGDLYTRDKKIAQLESEIQSSESDRLAMWEWAQQEIEGRRAAEEFNREAGRSAGNGPATACEECILLREQLEATENTLRKSVDCAEDQRAMMVEMQGEAARLREECKQQENEVRRFQNKYKKAKEDAHQLRKYLEAIEDESEEGITRRSELSVARERHRVEEQKVEREQREQIRDHSPLDLVQDEMLALLEQERTMARSLHEDLDSTRKLVIDKTTEVERLQADLSNLTIELAKTVMDLEMERGRVAEAVEIAEVNRSATSDVMLLMEELDLLRGSLQKSEDENLSLRCRLEAQGRDLIETKKLLLAGKSPSPRPATSKGLLEAPGGRAGRPLSRSPFGDTAAGGLTE